MSRTRNHREDNTDLSGGDPTVRINETPCSKTTKKTCAQHNEVYPRKMSWNEDTYPDNLKFLASDKINNVLSDSLASYGVVDAVGDGQSEGDKENNYGDCEPTVKDNKNQPDKVEEACSNNNEDDKKGRDSSETCFSEKPKNVFVKDSTSAYEFEKNGTTSQNVTVKEKKRDSIDRKSQTKKYGVGNDNRSKFTRKEDDDESSNNKKHQKDNLLNKLEDKASSSDNNEYILSDKHLKHKYIYKMKDQIENLTQENDVLKDRLKQRSQNEYLTLKKQIEDLELQNSNMKAVITQSEEKGEEYTKLMELLVEGLKNKHLSVLGHLWNKFSGKKSQPDDMVDKLAYISNFVKKLDTTVAEQKHLIEKKATELDKIRQTLSNARTEKEKLEKIFSRKSEEQTQLIIETDIELQKLKENKKYYEKQHSTLLKQQINSEKQLKECKHLLEQTQHELKEIAVKNDTLTRNLNIQISANTKLSEENHNIQKQILHLENCLRDVENESKECRKNMNLTKTLLNQECQSRAELNNTLKTQQHNLQMQEDNYLEHFNTLRDTLAIYYKMVSPGDVSDQAENFLVDKAIGRKSEIEGEAKQCQDQIKNSEGNCKSQTHQHIKEMLLRAIAELDAIESEDKEKLLAVQK